VSYPPTSTVWSAVRVLGPVSPETRRHSPLGNGIRDRQPRSNVLPISLFLHRPKEAIRQHLIPCQTPSRTPDVLFFTSVAELHIDWRHSSLWTSLHDGSQLPLPCVHHRSAKSDILTGNLQSCSTSCVTLFAFAKDHVLRIDIPHDSSALVRHALALSCSQPRWIDISKMPCEVIARLIKIRRTDSSSLESESSR
jgi:hypothetical protein